jgi:hypothetical protein
MSQLRKLLVGLTLAVQVLSVASAQDASVKPGINDAFRDPNPQEFEGKFEVESREVFARRQEIVAACKIQPGQTVADIGAGTGLFTRIFSDQVGPEGRVIAVDIAPSFLDHILASSREAGQQNVETVLCRADSTELPFESVDVAFICDAYHHFEFPLKTMASLHRAIKPGGRVVLIDFRRVEGTSTDWIMNHVRAGQDVFEAEITQSGFKKLHQDRELLKENYFVVFEKTAKENSDTDARPGDRVRGQGLGRGPGPEMRADQEIFHFLLEHHAEIRRSVKRLDKGVETLTESDNKEVASKLQAHVASMHERIKAGRGLRFWDDLFVAIFNNYDQIQMTVEKTEKGVKVIEISDQPAVVRLIQAHADVVSQFVAQGFDEAHKNHPVPVSAPAAAQLEFPIISNHGGVLPRPNAVEQPRAGAKVVFDVTAEGKPTDVNKGLDRVARLLNLYGVAGLKAQDVKITLVLHGEATKSVLNDAAYQTRFQVEKNPNLPLIQALQKVGVEVLVCGQALNYKGFLDGEVTDSVPIAAAALTVVINKQSDGYAVVPVP